MIVKSPKRVFLPEFNGKVSIFLAGSIEDGKADKWQDKVADIIEKEFGDSVVILNPRRDDWDASWKQTVKNNNFASQVNWEQDYLLTSDIVFFNIIGGTLSPVTMMEFGQVIDISNVVMCCENDFWRRGNIEVLCKNASPEVEVHANIDDAISELFELIKEILNVEEDTLG